MWVLRIAGVLLPEARAEDPFPSRAQPLIKSTTAVPDTGQKWAETGRHKQERATQAQKGQWPIGGSCFMWSESFLVRGGDVLMPCSWFPGRILGSTAEIVSKSGCFCFVPM